MILQSSVNEATVKIKEQNAHLAECSQQLVC